MAGAFAITTATTSTKLPATRAGQLQFTVTNTSGRQLTVRGVVVAPQSPEQKAWFSIEGQSERACEPNGTLQYTVNIAVPPSAPAGFVIVRFDAIGVENPDAYASQGPSVVLDVPPQVVPNGGPFPWWIVVVGAVALLLLGGGTGLAWYLTHSHGTPVVQNSPTPSSPSPDAGRFAGRWAGPGNAQKPLGLRLMTLTRNGNSLHADIQGLCYDAISQQFFPCGLAADGVFDPVRNAATFNVQFTFGGRSYSVSMVATIDSTGSVMTVAVSSTFGRSIYVLTRQ